MDGVEAQVARNGVGRRPGKGSTARRSCRQNVEAVVALILAVVAAGCSPPPDESADGPAVDVESGSVAAAQEGRITASGPFGFGRLATESEIARWDIDVGPTGEGLPAGSGSVEEGSEVWAADCARCHGETGVEGPYGSVVATEGAEDFPFGTNPRMATSIGNYWPYATTVFDYVRRSMPFDDPGSLTDSEVYAVTAWLLWRNEILAEDAVLDAESLSAVQLPAKEHFVPSDDVPLATLP